MNWRFLEDFLMNPDAVENLIFLALKMAWKCPTASITHQTAPAYGF